VRLAEQWTELLASLPQHWETASVTLTVAHPTDVERAALILGPAAPGRSDSAFRVDVVRRAHGAATGTGLFRRVLHRLDDAGIAGRLELGAGVRVDASDAAAAAPSPGGLAAQWQALLDALPPDWSHLLAQIDLDSSDFVERGALLLAPTNPTLAGGSRSFRIRAASRVGYGVAAEMARRCFERLDGERITGRISLVQVVSEARPVATQGPVFRIGGRSV
jgi:hypothetical protein